MLYLGPPPEAGSRLLPASPGRPPVRVLFDLLHPAHVHLFKNLSRELEQRGHAVRFTLREKECARDLLDELGLPYEVLSTQHFGAGLVGEFLQRGARLWRVAAHFEPHFLAGVMGPTIAPVGRARRLLGRNRARVAVFYGTEIAKLTNSFVYPLADYVITPDSYQGKVGSNHVTYPGFHELAYLHPHRFTPDRAVVEGLGIDTSQPYFVVRFVSYQASHDIGVNTLQAERKVELVRKLAERGRVLVSSEAALPPELERHRMKIPVSRIHHVLAFARMLVGESATMASEAAVLGVPAVYVSLYGRGFTDDLERYGLVKNFNGPRVNENWVAAVAEWEATPNLTDKMREAQARMLSEKVNLTSFMLEFFEREFEKHFPDEPR